MAYAEEALKDFGVAKPQVLGRTKEIDRLIKSLFPNSLRRKPLSLIAIGGYGRKTLCPYSDLDLLFLHEELDEKILTQTVESIIYPLWDRNFDVGYRVLTLEEVFHDAREDLPFLTALLSMRLVAGSKKLYQKFVSLFEKQLISGRRKEIFLALREVREKRLKVYQEDSFLLEPNIKEGLGGLRDYHFLLWTARVLFGLNDLREMERAGLISHAERLILKNSVNFLLCVREELHLLAKRKEDRLYFEYQPLIALKMGFGTRAETAIEKFMTCVYRAMKNINEAAEALFDHVEITLGLSSKEREILHEGFEILSGRIHLTYRERALIDPSYLLHLFLLQAETGLKLHNLTRIFLKENFPSNRLVSFEGKIFTKMLTKPHAALALRSMRDTGVLLDILPEFKRVLGLTQFDVYHIHPLDEHLILTVQELANLKREEPTFWKHVENEEVLFLAGLLHDITKGQGRGHAVTGAKVARDIAKRLGFTEEEAENVARLVEQHLLMVETAFRRDLTEEKVVMDFAMKVGNLPHLNRLYLLTVADSRATGPSAWNSWKASLLQELYLKAEKLFLEGVFSEKRTIPILVEREEILREKFGALVEVLPPCFLLHADIEKLIRGASLLKSYQEAQRELLLDIEEKKGLYQVVVITKDKPGLFANLAGVFTLFHLNIHSARVFTLTDGTVFDIFEVTSPYGEVYWDEFEKTLKLVLAGQKDLDKELNRLKPLVCQLKKPPKAPEIYVNVNNEHSDFFTIIEVFATDRLGLLYRLAKALSKWPVNIERAFIANREDLLTDVFYVRTPEGEKLGEEEIKSLKEYLQNTLNKIFSDKAFSCEQNINQHKEVVV
ncbi:[protein-PII] uridylyltransferase [Thermodesulfatator atlanticus]|uniref:[protein-PII] uridylyltransferase n=1 Tax=Thermodesulfatator atlanticus TaxID=501497 RepID=UPI0003B5096C|nr:[protein-PII] uridylyltransferase [Thermodesulfatator atlanticus]